MSPRAQSYITLRWRHNDHTGVSNHQPHGCLLNRLFRRRSNKTSKLRGTGLCAGNSPGPVNSPHKGPVTRKMFPFDDVIMRRRLIDSPLCPKICNYTWYNEAKCKRFTIFHDVDTWYCSFLELYNSTLGLNYPWTVIPGLFQIRPTLYKKCVFLFIFTTIHMNVIRLGATGVQLDVT